MQTTLRVRTTILPGHRIEITAPQLSEGDPVEVIVLAGTALQRRSMLELIESLPSGPLLFQTPQDANRHLREERDSWDN